MKLPDENFRAVHMEGGNYYDNMRIDIAESHKNLLNICSNPKNIRRPRYQNLLKIFVTRIAIRFGIYELLIVNGIYRKWLTNFQEYWSRILTGRPFWNTIDFFVLLHDYRKRQQHCSQLEWENSEQHLKNWQNPNEFYSIMHNARVLATNPVVCLALWNRIPKSASILEYGCSLAPYYHCYREFFTHLDCKWTLADIPNFPYHYARYLYRNDQDVELKIINENDFLNPLGSESTFDVIIATTVFEHLDNPLFVAEYLLKRLNINGLLVFDYIKSEGKGLDHPKALEMRKDCLEMIFDQLEIVDGNIENINETLGLCIAKNKNI